MPHPLSPVMATNLVVAFHTVPSADWFEAALRTIGRFYRFVSLDDVMGLVSGSRRFNSACHVTFDDGHRSFTDIALPILRRLSIPATLFVSPRVIEERTPYWFQELTRYRAELGDDPIRTVLAEHLSCTADQLGSFPLNSVLLCLPIDDIRRVLEDVRTRHRLERPPSENVTVDELRRLAMSGLVTLGGHTMDHPVLGNESEERARAEIQESVASLARMIDRPVTAFAYPNGTEGFDFGQREQNILRGAGVQIAFSTDPGFVGQRTNAYAVPRGGCPGLEGEPESRTASRLLLLPVWSRLSRLRARSRPTEAEERARIRALSPLLQAR
jgi:peptidoglycan/xylan/chitin deacetylase (PgdA/CDA1 family)